MLRTIAFSWSLWDEERHKNSLIFRWVSQATTTRQGDRCLPKLTLGEPKGGGQLPIWQPFMGKKVTKVIGAHLKTPKLLSARLPHRPSSSSRKEHRTAPSQGLLHDCHWELQIHQFLSKAVAGVFSTLLLYQGRSSESCQSHPQYLSFLGKPLLRTNWLSSASCTMPSFALSA